MKTSELTGIALDWVVMKCECAIPAAFKSIPALLNGTVRVFRKDAGCSEPVSPSTNWAHGGPIIEREKIGIECDDQGVWFASYDLSAETAWGATAPTPLVAAMRCYVASKLGDTVDIPEGLK